MKSDPARRGRRLLRHDRPLWRCLAAAAFLYANGCAVEVGNPRKPTDTKPSGGKMTISLGHLGQGQARQVYLSLQKIELAGDDVLVEVKLDKPDRVALIRSGAEEDGEEGDNSDLVPVSTSQEVPEGTYSAVILTLADGSQSAVVLDDDQERPLQLTGDGKNEIMVEEEISVSKDAEAAVSVRFDLQRSLRLPAAGGPGERVTFEPYVRRPPRGKPARIKGTVQDAAIHFVCAYIYDVLPPPPPPPPPGAGNLPPPPPPPLRPSGVQAKTAVIYEDREDIVRDEDTSCPHAFSLAPVVDGGFEIGWLPPASYDLRFFRKDGGKEDWPDPVSVMPGDLAEVTIK